VRLAVPRISGACCSMMRLLGCHVRDVRGVLGHIALHDRPFRIYWCRPPQHSQALILKCPPHHLLLGGSWSGVALLRVEPHLGAPGAGRWPAGFRLAPLLLSSTLPRPVYSKVVHGSAGSASEHATRQAQAALNEVLATRRWALLYCA
jgi:hypothetical protein